MCRDRHGEDYDNYKMGTHSKFGQVPGQLFKTNSQPYMHLFYCIHTYMLYELDGYQICSAFRRFYRIVLKCSDFNGCDILSDRVYVGGWILSLPYVG